MTTKFAVLTHWSWDNLQPELVEVLSETPTLIVNPTGQRFPKNRIMATFEDRESAQGLIDAIQGIREERDRQIGVANYAAQNAVRIVMESL